jgi:hypothetical protein
MGVSIVPEMAIEKNSACHYVHIADDKAVRQGLAQSHSGFPVDIVAGPRPQLVMADGRAHLLYELHVTNVAPIPIEVVALDVFGDDGRVHKGNKDY